MLAGGIEVADAGMDDAGIVVDLGRAGVEHEGSEGLRHRLLLLALLDERAGEPRPDLCIVRGERRRLAHAVFRADQIVHVQQRVPEVEVRGGVAGIVGEGGFVARDGLLPFPSFLKQVAEAVVCDGDGRMPVEQAAVQVDGEVRTAALSRDGRGQVQGVRLVGDRVEHAPGEPLRFAPVPGAVRVEGASQPPLDAGSPAGRASRPNRSPPAHTVSAGTDDSAPVP